MSVCACLSADGVDSGGSLCLGCRGRLTDYLSALPGLYRACEVIEESPGWYPGSVVFAAAATGVRTEMIAVLSSWAALIAKERYLIGPLPSILKGLVAFVTGHRRWLAESPTTGELLAEMATLVRGAQRVVNPSIVMHTHLARCGHVGCDERMTLPASLDGRPIPARVVCRAGHVVPTVEWLSAPHRGGRPRELAARAA